MPIELRLAREIATEMGVSFENLGHLGPEIQMTLIKFRMSRNLKSLRIELRGHESRIPAAEVLTLAA